MVLSACGSTAQATVMPTIMVDPYAMYAPDAVSGDIITAGSSTVFPLSERMSELFSDEGFTGKITIDSIGSGAGYERFCVEGESDIANASRAIKDSEVESCKAIDRVPLEFRVGTDAIAIAVSSSNDFLTDISMAELALIFSPSANWFDAPSASPWPSPRASRACADSGTFDF